MGDNYICCQAEKGSINISEEVITGVVKSAVSEVEGVAGLSYTVAGKTGSAEFGNVKGQSHSWFTGFSNPDDPDIVVTVIMENGGSGSENAVPAANYIFDRYYGLY